MATIQDHSGLRQEDSELPPGTFHLLQELDSTSAEILTLNPPPTRDPNQPLNWSKFRKTLNFTLVLAVTLVIFTTLSVQVIFWQLLVIDLKATFAQLNNAQSCNATGLTLGCVLFIPFTLKYGRRPIYIISTAIMFAMTVWSSRMTTVTELYVTNFFLGLAGATNESIVGLTIADLFFVHQRGTMNGFYLIMVMTGSFLTPLLAGVQATNQGWRWSYYLLSLFTGLLLLIFVFFFEETKYLPILNGRQSSSCKAYRETDRKHDPSQTVTTVGVEITPANEPLAERIDSTIPMKKWRERFAFVTPTDESLLKLFYRPFIILFKFPTVMFTALQYGSGLCWLVNMAVIISMIFPYPPYMFNPAKIGYMGVGPFVGNLIGSIYSGYLTDKAIVSFSKRNKGYYEPEMRLYLLHLPSAAMCGGLIMFGVTTAKGMHWIYPSVGGALFGFGLGSFGDISLTIVIDSYRNITGEAFVGIAFVRNVFSIAMAQIRLPWMQKMGLQNMFILMGFLSLFISLLYIPLIYFGKRSRAACAARYYQLSEKRI